MLGPLVPRDVDDVAETFIREHAGARAFVLEHRIGCRGGAMQDVVDIAGGNVVVAADRDDALNDSAGRIVGRGGNFVDRDLTGIQIAIDDIGEGASDIDPDTLHDAPARLLPLIART